MLAKKCQSLQNSLRDISRRTDMFCFVCLFNSKKSSKFLKNTTNLQNSPHPQESFFPPRQSRQNLPVFFLAFAAPLFPERERVRVFCSQSVSWIFFFPPPIVCVCARVCVFTLFIFKGRVENEDPNWTFLAVVLGFLPPFSLRVSSEKFLERMHHLALTLYFMPSPVSSLSPTPCCCCFFLHGQPCRIWIASGQRRGHSA